MAKKTQHVLAIILFFVAFALVFAICFTGCASVDDWVRNTIIRYYYRSDGDYSCLNNMEGLTVGGMMDRLDKYSAYYSAEEFAQLKRDNAGQKNGVGISVANGGNGALITRVIGGSPARRAGLEAGDVITYAERNGSLVPIRDKAGFTEFIDGMGEGETATFCLADGSRKDVSKISYTASYASMYMNDCGYAIEYSGQSMNISEVDGVPQLPGGAAYVRLSQFYGNAANELKRLIGIFNERSCTDFILDLRGNGGGYVDVMESIGGLFTSAEYSSAVAMYAEYKDGSRATGYCAHYNEDFLPAGTNVYVMADEDTASASEALIGVLVSYNILDYADIFLSDYGTRPPKSYGKGIMQSTFTHGASGNVLKLTVAGLYWKNGKTIHGVGLTLDDGCTAAPAGDEIVNIGYDDELQPVINRILSVRARSVAAKPQR